MELHHGTVAHSLLLILEEIGIGLLVGVGLAYISATLMKAAIKREWNSPLWDQITLMSLAIVAFTMALQLGGSGFIAAFVCGLIAGRVLEDRHSYLHHNEGYADLLSVFVWIAFGAIVLTNTWPYFSWKTWTYAIASLTLLRMLPVWLSLWGTTLDTESRLFLGWFGLRGLASIVFAVIVMQYELVAMHEVVATVVCTVLLSVVLHGLTANPWVARLGRQVDN